MIKSITSVKVAGRRVIVRAGFDVPIERDIQTEQWMVADDTRIRDAITTLKYLIEHKAKIILISHLDRPAAWEKEKSLWPTAVKLSELLGLKVVKVSDRLPDYQVPQINFLTEDITKNNFSALSLDLTPGSILFLENLRFYKQEQKNEEAFAGLLSDFGDLYVNEAFSDAHREDASIVTLPGLLPSYGGISFIKEISALDKLLKNPIQPMIVLLGGVKIDDKVATLRNLGQIAAHIIVGGAVGNTFLKALGYEVGKSKVSDIRLAGELLRDFKDKIVLPSDLVVAENSMENPAVVKLEKVRPNHLILDIGPESIRKFSSILKQAKTMVWNGPFGLIENPKFAFGSKSLAHIFASRSKGSAFGVIGGGETIEFIDRAKVSQYIDHISMGGGAMLEFLAGKQLPGIRALESK